MRGDKDSIRNLLEIFDGLLEYLTEQLSEEEELPNGGEGFFFSSSSFDYAVCVVCFLFIYYYFLNIYKHIVIQSV